VNSFESSTRSNRIVDPAVAATCPAVAANCNMKRKEGAIRARPQLA
jgi:hypothetical protein